MMVVTHFFDYDGNELERSIEGLLRSLLFQILQGRPRLLDVILPKFFEKRQFHANFSWSAHDLRALFRDFLHHPECTSTCILVDALGEYNGEDIEIAEYIDEVSHLARDDLCFCVSSRPYPDFAYQFKSCEGKVLMDAHNLEDIRSYCSSRLASLMTDVEPGFNIMIDLIVRKADRVFLWVKLVIDDILRGFRRRESLEKLLQRVDSMPTSLNDFYRRMMQEIRRDEREEVDLIIGIVACSKKILLLEECYSAIGHYLALSEEPWARSFSLSANPETFGERVEAICSGLVEITRIEFGIPSFKNETAVKSSRSIVKLSHQTVSEFLSARKNGKGLHLDGHLVLFMACMHSIKSLEISELKAAVVFSEDSDGHTDFRYPMILNSDQKTLFRDSFSMFAKDPFLDYAISHWIQHAKKVDSDCSPLYFKFLHEFS